MKLIVCVDEKNGFAFFGKRQSRDSILIERVVKKAEGRLIVSEYSAPLFEAFKNIRVESDPYNIAQGHDFCFAERSLPPTDKAEEIILYCWNRHYPADVFFSVDEKSFTLVSEQDFTGSSHKKITEKIYKRV